MAQRYAGLINKKLFAVFRYLPANTFFCTTS
jgi:hypothetical protein